MAGSDDKDLTGDRGFQACRYLRHDLVVDRRGGMVVLVRMVGVAASGSSTRWQ